MEQKYMMVFEIQKLKKERLRFINRYIDIFTTQRRINYSHQHLKNDIIHVISITALHPCIRSGRQDITHRNKSLGMA